MVNLSCGRAGPHWKNEQPDVVSPAVDLPRLFDEPEKPAVRRLEPFALDEVKLLPGTHLSRATNTNLRYLHTIDTDSLLYAWRQNAGLDTRRARPFQGWEHPSAELRGHFLGHYLSATRQKVERRS